MPAKTANLPSLRRMFIPDPDHTMIEADLERADAQVVAWDAGDETLKQMFREGADIHTENAITIFKCSRQAADIGGSNSPRQKAKQGIHAVNYWCQSKTLAATLGITVHEADLFIKSWLSAHPAIRLWHESVWRQLGLERRVRNRFGFHITYTDRIERSLLSDALAWICSSTVSIVTHKGMLNIHGNLPEVELLLNNHDSLLMQTPTKQAETFYPKIIENMLIPVPYPDPLVIPVTLAASDKSWGDVEDVEKIETHATISERLVDGVLNAHAV